MESTRQTAVSGRRVTSLLGKDPDTWKTSSSPIGNGQVAECYRWALEGPSGQTEYVVAKSPSQNATSRATASIQRLYLRETSFYSIVRPLVSIPTPELFHVEYSPDNDDFLILLEDLTPSRALDQFAGLNFDDAATALKCLAGLHAPTVERLDLFAKPWLGGVAVELAPLYEAVLPGLFDEFLSRYGDAVEPQTRLVIERLRKDLGVLASAPPALRCVAHGDYRTDNLIFDGRLGERPLTVVDWQTIGVASPLTDVAYFITTSLATDDRVDFEHQLIDLYLDEMRTRGVDIPLNVARHEFARSTLQPIVMLVSASVIVERTERGDAMFLTMIRRAVDAVSDWNAFEELH